eukprot:1256782-Pyramimonas_sp.AAC.3
MFWKTKLSEETVKRIHTSCGAQIKGLENCRRANEGNPSVCDSMILQLDLCRGHITDPEIADKLGSCIEGSFDFRLRKFHQKGKCDDKLAALQKALRKYRNLP